MGSYSTPSGSSIQNTIVDPSPSNTVTTETSFGQVSNAGVSGLYSRGDHTHGTPTAPLVPSASNSVVSETSFGQGSNAGASSTYSRGDHTHGTPAAPVIPTPFAAQSSPGRSLNSTYQNTSGKTMLVTVSVTAKAYNGSGSYHAVAKSDAGSPPSTVVATIGADADNQVNGTFGIFSLSFMVLNNNYYRVDTATSNFGSISLTNWTEWS